MLKKLGVLCLILSFALAAAVLGAEAALISGNTYEAAGESGETPESPLAELGFNYINDGSVTKSYTAYIDKDALTEGLSGNDKTRAAASAVSALDGIADLWEAYGYEVTSAEDGRVTAVAEYYASITDLYIAYGYNGYDKNEKTDTIWGPLYNIYVNKTESVFGHIEEISPLAEAAAFLLTAEGVTRESVSYIYNYGTRYSTDAIRSDADRVYADSSLGVIIHSFEMGADDLDREITLYQISPNTLTWYAAAAAVALLFAGIAAVIYARKVKKDK